MDCREIHIPLSAPDITESEIACVTEVLRGGHLSLGPKLAEFEERFADYVGARYAIAANSGTSALHLCVRALGIGAGDEAITTSFSFVASSNCLFYEGAVPRFVDIDPVTLNIRPEAIRSFLETKCKRARDGRVTDQETGRVVKAILPVHVFGMPCDMRAIAELADEYGLAVLEDACEAIGAELDGKRAGTFGQAGVFAFYPNKQMTTGEGGMVVTNDSRIAEACRSLRNQGRDASAAWLKHVRLGYNYRLSDIQAAVGIAQLARIGQILETRAKVAEKYSERLAQLAGVVIPPPGQGCKRSWFVYVVQFAGEKGDYFRDRVKAHLLSKGIACQIYFPPIHQQPYFEDLCPGYRPRLPNTECASGRCLALPFFTGLSDSDIHLVCGEVKAALEHCRSEAEISRAAERPGKPAEAWL